MMIGYRIYEISVANGMDIKTFSTILGHISSKTTLDIYLHSTDEMKQQDA